MSIARSLIVLLEPVGLLWLALIVFALLLWRKRQRGFAVVAAALAAFIQLIGGSDFPDALLRSIERPYVGVKFDALPVCDAVVMPGGGLEPSSHEVAGLHLTRAGDRLIAALELIRLGKAPVLVCGGAGVEIDGTDRIEADLLRDALTQRRVRIPEIHSLGHCLDTHDEALRTSTLARQRGWHRILLVTSATHLQRATAAFRHTGIEVVPVPCNFLTGLSRAPATRWLAIPGYGGFEKMAVWLHEEIGTLEYRRRGWLAPG